MAGYYGGERNVPGAVGNIGGTANSFLAGNPSFDVNKGPGALGGRSEEQIRRLLQSTPNNQQLLEEMKRRGITPSGGPQLPLAGSPFGSSNLAGATAQMNPGQPGNFAGFTDQLQAQNQGPSTPVKYYPDAFGGQGGILPNRGAAGPANVRPKGSTPLAQDFTEDSDGMEQMLAQLRENQSSLPTGFINKYVS